MAFLDETGVEYLVADIKEKTDATYQPILVSGTNIKTVNNTSLLGSGDISISTTPTTWYGTSSTSADTATKVVACDNFVLTKGATLLVLFSTANTTDEPKLNVNSTGAVSIYIGSSVPSRTNSLKWLQNTLLFFVYDGTHWRYITSRANATTALPEGAGCYDCVCSTIATDSVKAITLPMYRYTSGSILLVRCTTANTYVGALTVKLNGNSNTTSLYVNGANTSASNPLLWDAGELLVLEYNGSYFSLVCKSKSSLPIASTSTLGGVKVDGTTITADANGVISAVGGGAQITTTTVTIATSEWSNSTCTKNVTGVTASNSVIVTYAPASKDGYTTANVYCSAQGAGTLTFSCDTTPTASVTANVMIIDGTTSVLFSATGTGDGYVYVNTSFVPTIGTTYRVSFTCTDTNIQPQGNDISLTARTYGGQPSLVAEDEYSGWYVQFNGTTAFIASDMWFGTATVSLTIYDN